MREKLRRLDPHPFDKLRASPESSPCEGEERSSLSPREMGYLGRDLVLLVPQRF